MPMRKYHIILKAGKRKTEDDMGGREDTVGEVKERKASMFRRKEILGEKETSTRRMLERARG